MIVEVVETPVPTPPKTYNIVGLTHAEACHVKAILGSIVGLGPLRTTADEIYYAFGNAGLPTDFAKKVIECMRVSA